MRWRRKTSRGGPERADPLSTPESSQRRAPGYAIALVVVLALIAYASLYPFDLRWSRLTSALHGPWLQQMLHQQGYRADVIANLLFYLPLGYVLWLGARRETSFAARCAIYCLVGASISFGFEVLQHLEASRTPSLLDVALNAASTLLGCAAAQAWRSTGIEYRPQRWLGEKSFDLAGAALLLVWGAFHSAPFVPKLGLYRAWNALEAVRDLDWTRAGSARWTLCYLILICLLRVMLVRERFWLLLAAATAASFLSQTVFIHRQLEFDEIFGAAFAWLVALALWRRALQWQLRTTLAALVLGILVATLRNAGWVPFEGYFDPGEGSRVYAVLMRLFLYGGTLWVAFRAWRIDQNRL